MRKIILGFFIGLLATSFSCLSQSQAPKEMKSVTWLIGTWKMSMGTKGSLYEIWHYVNDSTFQNRAFLVRSNGDTIPNERVQLKYRDKKMRYESTVSGQNNNQAVTFMITELTKNGFTAENPSHDFPQRIIYVLENTGRLNARIEGTVNGNFKKQEFPMEKIK